MKVQLVARQASSAVASSQGSAAAGSAAASPQGTRDKASNQRSAIFRELGEKWAVQVLFKLGDIPVVCVNAANERVAQKVRQNEHREVERLLIRGLLRVDQETPTADKQIDNMGSDLKLELLWGVMAEVGWAL